MKFFKSLIVVAVALFSLSFSNFSLADEVSEKVVEALANKNRPEDDTFRDAQRKPGEVLTFYGIDKGMTVLDLYSSTGYYTVILSNLVGPDGKVFAHNTPRGKERFGEMLTEKYQAFQNVDLKFSEPDTVDVPDNSVDAAILVLVYHHLHYNKDEGENLPKATKSVLKEIHRVLKPGGIFGVIEHQAAEGANREDSANWHRTPANTVIVDVTSVGFKYVDSADIHVNPDDEMNNNWNTTGLRGKTTRLVQKFQKN